MPELKLKDWENKGEVGTRFPPSRQVCPKCNQPVLEDTWPPNYSGGSALLNPDGNSSSENHGSQKFVCLSCRIAFCVSWHETTKYIDDGTFLGERKSHRKTVISKPVPLVEKDGYLLTPHDVWQEKVKEETGQYPVDAYG